MTSFNELQSEWKNQHEVKPSKDGYNTILKRVKSIRNKQRIANVVLSITLLILCFFFLYISGYKNNMVILGISMMVGSLVIRIGAELLSIKKLRAMDVLLKVEEFKLKLVKYYKQRIVVHYILTPLVIAVYCFGFILLLPLFKASLSAGFYNYILISSVVLLLVLGGFIIVQIRRELSSLRKLKNSEEKI